MWNRGRLDALLAKHCAQLHDRLLHLFSDWLKEYRLQDAGLRVSGLAMCDGLSFWVAALKTLLAAGLQH